MFFSVFVIRALLFCVNPSCGHYLARANIVGKALVDKERG